MPTKTAKTLLLRTLGILQTIHFISGQSQVKYIKLQAAAVYESVAQKR